MAEKAGVGGAALGGGRRSTTQREREERARAALPVDGFEGEGDVGRSEGERKTSLRAVRVMAFGGRDGAEGARAGVGAAAGAGAGDGTGAGAEGGLTAERLKLNFGFAPAWVLREARRSCRDLSSYEGEGGLSDVTFEGVERKKRGTHSFASTSFRQRQVACPTSQLL